MSSMLEVKFSDDIKRLKHFTKIDENTWFVQRDKGSICESYYVTLLQGALVMYGDYGGVIVNPYISDKRELIHWMANATTLSYFCEKVGNGNQHHQYKEFSSEIAKESALEQIGYKFELSELVISIINKGDENMLSFDDLRDELLQQFALEMSCHQENVERDFEEDWDEFEQAVIDYLDASFEQERDYFDFCEEHDFVDWCEHSYEDYSFRIKHQHQCLLWWARNVIEKEVQ